MFNVIHQTACLNIWLNIVASLSFSLDVGPVLFYCFVLALSLHSVLFSGWFDYQPRVVFVLRFALRPGKRDLLVLETFCFMASKRFVVLAWFVLCDWRVSSKRRFTT